MRIDIPVPDPSVVVLVGAAGSGKSTFAARHFAPGEVLSSDAFRARLGHGEADQAVSRRAFGALHAALERRLAAGRTTVVDATNVQPTARRDLVRRAVAAGVPAIAIVFDLPLADCLAGDRLRPGRHVPAAVVERQWEALRAAIDAGSLAAEGFTAVHRLTSRAVVDSIVLGRGPEGWPTLSAAVPPDR
jgi:protein phosphatase